MHTIRIQNKDGPFSFLDYATDEIPPYTLSHARVAGSRPVAQHRPRPPGKPQGHVQNQHPEPPLLRDSHTHHLLLCRSFIISLISLISLTSLTSLIPLISLISHPISLISLLPLSPNAQVTDVVLFGRPGGVEINFLSNLRDAAQTQAQAALPAHVRACLDARLCGRRCAVQHPVRVADTIRGLHAVERLMPILLHSGSPARARSVLMLLAALLVNSPGNLQRMHAVGGYQALSVVLGQLQPGMVDLDTLPVLLGLLGLCDRGRGGSLANLDAARALVLGDLWDTTATCRYKPVVLMWLLHACQQPSNG